MPDIHNQRIYPGEVTSRLRGIEVINSTGSDMPKGTLVYVSGWDATAKRFKASFATSVSSGVRFATAVLDRALTNGSSGQAYMGAAVAGLNTSSKTVGDAVYLSTAGTYTYTAPTFNVQPVGYVAVVDATAGVIEFNIPDAGPATARGGDGDVLYTEVALTLANMLALRATPITVVAAPGAGKAVEFISGTFIYDYGSAAFTVSNAGDDMQLRWTDGSGAKASEIIEPTGLLTVAGDGAQAITKLAAAAPVLKAVFENAPLVLHNIGAAEYTVGTGGACRIKVAYRVISTGW